MPLGKSGNYHMNPHEMRRRGDSPDEKPVPDKDGNRSEDNQQEAGDGNHHHELHGHEDGSYSSSHTHPDGQKDEQEVGSYDEAKAHMDQCSGQGDQDQGDGQDIPPVAAPAPEDDIAGRYAE